ncbi:DUF11 domain-containing protein [Candidatus Peregrinibacteria bacterium]|nr:MAG: DUF11 domain-containing protein [Candidatus Peregrinibacteria bacterium]
MIKRFSKMIGLGLLSLMLSLYSQPFLDTMAQMIAVDLRITQNSVNPTVASPGIVLTYQVDYINLGPLDALGTELALDYDQVNLINVTLNDPRCFDNGDVLTCFLGNLGLNEGGSITYTAQVGTNVADGTVISNVASITATEAADVSGNSVQVDVPVVDNRSADPAIIAKTVDNLNPLPGDTVTYTIDYANLGDLPANNLDMEDLYDAINLTNINFIAGTCLDDPSGTISCKLGDVPVGGTGQVIYSATVRATTTPGSAISNSVRVAGVQDSDLTNNSGAVTFTVQTPVSLANPQLVQKVANTSTPLPGGTLTYTITYAQNGSLDATNTVIVDDYDEGALSNIVLNDPRCADNGAVITCNLGLVPTTASANLSYTATVMNTVPPGTVIANVATISADVNNSATDDTAQVNVTVATPPVTPPPVTPPHVTPPATGGGGGGGSGGPSGGRLFYEGDLKLAISHFVSTDGLHFTLANSESNALLLAQGSQTIYHRISIHNPNPVSIEQTELDHAFIGSPAVYSNNLAFLSGARIGVNGLILVDRINTLETHDVTYQVTVSNNSGKEASGIDMIVLNDYKAKVPSAHDGFNYLGIGKAYPAYFSGNPIQSNPTSPLNDDRMALASESSLEHGSTSTAANANTSGAPQAPNGSGITNPERIDLHVPQFFEKPTTPSPLIESVDKSQLKLATTGLPFTPIAALILAISALISVYLTKFRF